LTADTAAELLFAISGAEIHYDVTYSRDQPVNIDLWSSIAAADTSVSSQPFSVHDVSNLATLHPEGLRIIPEGTIAAGSDPRIDMRLAA
jgi:hypothetical protein